MNSRPWTAILVSDTQTLIIDVYAPVTHDAAETVIKEKFPGKRVVAIIPGFHAKCSFALPVLLPSKTLGSPRIDPFNMPDL